MFSPVARREDSSTSDGEQSYSEDDEDDAITQALQATLTRPAEDIGKLEGNIYRFFAFHAIGAKKEKAAGGKRLFNMEEGSRLNMIIFYCGLILVVFIQIIAPLTIFASNLADLRSSLRFPVDFAKYDPSQACVVILATAFLFCFVLNTYNQLGKDSQSDKKAIRLAKVLTARGKTVHKWCLMAGIIINNYMAVSLSICMFSLMFKEEDGISIFFDAMSLSFIFSLDDVASDVGFLDGIWNEDTLGSLYTRLVGKGKEKEDKKAGFGRQGSKMSLSSAAHDAEDVAMFQAPMILQSTSQKCLMFLLVLALFAPFFIESQAKSDASLLQLLSGNFTEFVPTMPPVFNNIGNVTQ